MATHVLRHPAKGKCFVDLGRYQQFTLRWSKDKGTVPKVHPNDQWDTILSALSLEGVTCEQIAWITPHIAIFPHPDVRGMWMAECEAMFNGVKTVCSCAANSPEEVRDLFWSQWNEDRRAASEPTHLAIMLRSRYRITLPV